MTFLKRVVLVFIWSYAGFMGGWFLLHQLFGDTIWWLALLNVFVPYFFLPLMVFILLSLVYQDRRIWWGVLGVVVIFIALYGNLFWPAWPAQEKAISHALTLMTFNIWGGSHLLETVEVVQVNDFPEVVVLQELTPVMADLLSDTVGDRYPYRVLALEQGLGIFSQYPVSPLAELSMNSEAGQIQVVDIEVGPTSIRLYHCRLSSPNVLAYWEEGRSMAQEVKRSFRLRQRLAESLAGEIAAYSGPVLVAGDFNSTDQSDVYKVLTRQMVDVHREIGWGFGHTFPAYQGQFRGIPIFPRQMRLDMVFHTPDLRSLAIKVSPVHGESDHLPVVAEVGW